VPLNALFPPTLDNVQRGSPIALWLFAPILAMKSVIGLNISGLNPFVSSREILQTVDGVPLDTFPAEAAQTAVGMASGWGVATLVLCLVCWLMVARYRAALPIAILALLAEQVLRKIAVTVQMGPGDGAMSAGTIVNWGFLAALVIAFGLSLWPRRAAAALPA